MEAPPTEVQKTNANLFRRMINSTFGKVRESNSWKYAKKQIVFTGSKLLVEGAKTRAMTAGKFGIAAQLVYSGGILAYESLKGAVNGSTYAQIAQKVQESLFLQDVLYAVVKDGQMIHNLDTGVLLGMILPSSCMGLYKAASARLGNLIWERETEMKAAPPDAEKTEVEPEIKYKPTKMDIAKAYAMSVLDKIPKYLLAAYATTVSAKTDLLGILAIKFDAANPAAKQAMTALQDTTTNWIFGTAFGLYAMWTGVKMLRKKD